VAYFIW